MVTVVEWHLLRHLGRHRNLLDKTVRDATGCGGLEWLDFGFGFEAEVQQVFATNLTR